MNDKEIKELQNIKKLLIVELLIAGVQATDLAKLIEMDPDDFSRLFPVRTLLKNIKKKNSAG